MTSPELLDESAPPLELVVSAWLSPWKRGTKRKAGDPLPFRLIHAGPGSDDDESGLTDQSVSIHTFAGSPIDALTEATKTHRRMLKLARNPLAEITIPTGQVVCVDYVRPTMLPEEVDYGDPNVIRYVARYDIGLSYTTAPQ